MEDMDDKSIEHAYKVGITRRVVFLYGKCEKKAVPDYHPQKNKDINTQESVSRTREKRRTENPRSIFMLVEVRKSRLVRG